MVPIRAGLFLGDCRMPSGAFDIQTFGGLDGSGEAPSKWHVWGAGARGAPGVRRMSEFILETEDLTKEFAGFRRRQRRQPAGRARHHPCADRAERRRQDHLLQPADQVPAADPGPHHLQGPRHHARCRRPRWRGSAWCARSRSRRCFRISPCWRTCASRCSASAAARSTSGARSRVLERVQRARAGADRRCRAVRLCRMRPRSNCPMAASARSRSPRRWRSIRRCCCSTSRPPAWATRTSSGSRR